MTYKPKPGQHQRILFGSAAIRKKRIESPDDERLKQEWLEQHAITKLPAGWSRYGY